MNKFQVGDLVKYISRSYKHYSIVTKILYTNICLYGINWKPEYDHYPAEWYELISR